MGLGENTGFDRDGFRAAGRFDETSLAAPGATLPVHAQREEAANRDCKAKTNPEQPTGSSFRLHNGRGEGDCGLAEVALAVAPTTAIVCTAVSWIRLYQTG